MDAVNTMLVKEQTLINWHQVYDNRTVNRPPVGTFANRVTEMVHRSMFKKGLYASSRVQLPTEFVQELERKTLAAANREEAGPSTPQDYQSHESAEESGGSQSRDARGDDGSAPPGVACAVNSGDSITQGDDRDNVDHSATPKGTAATCPLSLELREVAAFELDEPEVAAFEVDEPSSGVTSPINVQASGPEVGTVLFNCWVGSGPEKLGFKRGVELAVHATPTHRWVMMKDALDKLWFLLPPYLQKCR